MAVVCVERRNRGKVWKSQVVMAMGTAAVDMLVC